MLPASNIIPHPASFKDPAGYIFESRGKIHRQVNKIYGERYRMLMQSGLYKKLADDQKLITHAEITDNLTGDPQFHVNLLPEQLGFISYPYEWSFHQLKDAALLTLSIAKASLEFGMILKDATPYNIQFHNGKPVFIDTLSFDHYNETEPWVAYRQFCETFLFPLYLEHYLKIDCIPWLSNYIHGIPVHVVAKLLPWKAHWNLGVRLHVLLQNNIGSKKAVAGTKTAPFSKQKMLNLLNHLESIISGLKDGYPQVSTWSNYYDETILGKEYLSEKEKIVTIFCSQISYNTVLDLGANDGYFSQLLAKQHKSVVAVDSDSRCIDRLYLQTKSSGQSSVTALISDLSNPSAAIGFQNKERSSFTQRAKADLLLALALVHHLCIARNIPVSGLAAYFADMAPHLIIEFVPKEDEKVKQLLASRADIFEDYHQAHFEECFSRFYHIQAKETIPGTTRVLYRMKRK